MELPLASVTSCVSASGSGKASNVAFARASLLSSKHLNKSPFQVIGRRGEPPEARL